MNNTLLHTPTDTAKRAMLIAQGRCIKTKGDFCEGYDGVSCITCRRFGVALERRRINREKEAKITLGEHPLRGNKVMQLREDDHYFTIIIGERIKELDRPDIFKVERSLTLNPEEMLTLKYLIDEKVVNP